MPTFSFCLQFFMTLFQFQQDFKTGTKARMIDAAARRRDYGQNELQKWRPEIKNEMTAKEQGRISIEMKRK